MTPAENLADLNVRSMTLDALAEMQRNPDEVIAKMARDERIRRAVALSKEQILEDMKSGRVPDSVRDFGTLHDYVDANEYGGLVTSRRPSRWMTPR